MKRRISQKGSALLTVVMLTAIMAILTASMLKYSGSEQRSNERQRLILRSRNMTENVVIYASEQITNKLYRLRSSSPMWFTGANGITLPPTNVLSTQYSTASDVEVRAGLTTTSGLIYLDPNDPVNAGNPNAGLQVSNSMVPIIGKSTMRHSSIGTITTYARQDLEVAMMPLFQFAVFYNMDMEFGPGPNMTLSGPVHTNGDLIARIQTGFANTLRFTDRVTSAKGFYANTAHKGSTYMGSGAVDSGPGGTGPLLFQNLAGVTTDIKNGSNVWRDHKWTSSATPGSVAETATTLSQFRNFATTAYAGNLRTSVHGVTKLVLPAIGDYDETDPLKKTNGRQVIEPPSAADAGGVLGTKFSRNAGLYIIVNPDANNRNGTLPDGSSVAMRARSYRAWLNRVNADGTHTIKEVILPGQPSYGPLNANVNNLPNAYRTDTSVGHNQVLRIPKGGGVDFADTGYGSPGIPTYPTLTDSYFYDLRRAFNNTGAPYARTGGNNYRPRPIAKIDFDMTRFRMAVQRTLISSTTASIYYPSYPISDATWNASVFNSGAAAANFGLGLAPGTDTSFALFPARDSIASVQRSQDATFAPGTITIGATSQTGAAAAAAYNGRFTIEQSSDNGITFAAPFYTSAANEASYNYTPQRGVTHIRVRLFIPGAAPVGVVNMLDQQVIPIVSDQAPLAINCAGGFATGRFRIYDTTTAVPAAFGAAYAPAWTLRYSSVADESSFTYTPNNGITAIQVIQYQPGGFATVVNTQVIPVVSASLSNDYWVAPMTTALLPFNYNGAVTEMKVFVGGVDDTANWTFTASAPTGSMSGYLGANATTTAAQTGSGQFANRYTATAISLVALTTTGYVDITASKTGFNPITRRFTYFKQSSLTGGAAAPINTGYWLTIGGAPTPDPFKIYLAPADPLDANILANPATFAPALSDFIVNSSSPSPWFDGITIYVESVSAENLTVTGVNNAAVRNRVSSGVRLWNGRGSLISLPGATYPGRTGLSFATNDAVYIVGHYNADGTLNSTLTSTGVGGYSGRYPESNSEMLTAVMGDALTVLSHPLMTRSGAAPLWNYNQSGGWADSLSSHKHHPTANYDAAFQSTNPSNANSVDGLQSNLQPSMLPSLSLPSNTVGYGPRPRVTLPSGTPGVTAVAPGNRTEKFAPSDTEISTCLLTGIVPTTLPSGPIGGQSSGGVHNFPRLQENWAGTAALYIRGSLVAMYESQVATEPWGIRWYQGAIRNWGLHESLRNANHDVPLEPIVLGARRMSYRELSKAEYDAQKVVIEALPH